jgi:hypothetical protein
MYWLLKWFLPLTSLRGWFATFLCGSLHSRGPGWAFNWINYLSLLPIPIIPKMALKFAKWWWPDQFVDQSSILLEFKEPPLPISEPVSSRWTDIISNHPYLAGLVVVRVVGVVRFATWYLFSSPPVEVRSRIGSPDKLQVLDSKSTLEPIRLESKLIHLSSVERGDKRVDDPLWWLPSPPTDDRTQPEEALQVVGSKVNHLKALLAAVETPDPAPKNNLVEAVNKANLPVLDGSNLVKSIRRDSGGPWAIGNSKFANLIKDLDNL